MDPADLLALVRDRPATLGTGRLLCIDGPSGAGKTTLATAVARLDPAARVVHMDALYDGWGGLSRVAEQLGTILGPLASGEPGRYRRYDWHAGAYVETVIVPTTPLLIVEGVGSWSPSYAPLVTTLVWLDAPAAERMARAVARDGAEMAEHLQQWAIDEQEHFARTGARDRADVTVVAP